MYVASESPQAVESVWYVVLLFSIVCVVFWRALLKIVITIVAVVVLALLATGAILILENIHHFNG
jgi:hypothetical protein